MPPRPPHRHEHPEPRHERKAGESRPPHGPKHGRHARERTLEGFVDRTRIERLIEPWVPDGDDRAFVLRCLLDEGPAHHRGVNWILLSLLGELMGNRSVDPAVGEHVRVPLRLPPHLRRHHDDEEGDYPLPLPMAPLRHLAGNDDQAVDAMVECLTDGPPQHALGNAAMLLLIDALLRR